MHESSSAQKKPRRGKNCVKNFLLKRQKVFLHGSMLVTGLEKGGEGEGGGGCNNFFINSDLKTTQHRYKENKFLTFYQSTF